MFSTCPNCGFPRDDAKRFCRACGLDQKAAQGAQNVRPAAPVERAPPTVESGPTTAGFLVGAIVAMAIVGGTIAFLQGAEDDVTREAATELGDDPMPNPTPNPTPTARRPRSPTPDSGQRAFKEFVEHVTRKHAVIVDGMESVDAAATRVDVEALQRSSIDLWLVLGEEVQWMEDNPPKRCYRDAHSAYADAITTLHDALDVISDGALDRNPDVLNRGSKNMITGNRLIDDATALIRPANRACRMLLDERPLDPSGSG
jgi:hypothetical protein